MSVVVHVAVMARLAPNQAPSCIMASVRTPLGRLMSVCWGESTRSLARHVHCWPRPALGCATLHWLLRGGPGMLRIPVHRLRLDQSYSPALKPQDRVLAAQQAGGQSSRKMCIYLMMRICLLSACLAWRSRAVTLLLVLHRCSCFMVTGIVMQVQLPADV